MYSYLQSVIISMKGLKVNMSLSVCVYDQHNYVKSTFICTHIALKNLLANFAPVRQCE